MGTFNIDFNVDNYKHLYPEKPSDETEIINYNKDIKDAIWMPNRPENPTGYFLEMEFKRLTEGAFINIKGELIWLPPQYYQFLQYAPVS